MTTGRFPRSWIDVGVVPLLLVLSAAWWVFGYMVPRTAGIVSYDIVNAYYPNVVYALRSLREGSGLLWIGLQNCGQPFLPVTLLGPYYPLNLVYLVFDVPAGILVIAFLHLVAGGVGTYLLCREIGLGRAAALTGAVSFEMGSYLTEYAGWLPVTIMGSYVWLPAALFLCERTVRKPGLRSAIALGAILTVSLFGAYPQMTMFIYQVLLLRILLELILRHGRLGWRTAGALVLGLGLPPLLGAAHLFPALEFALHSLRDRPLTIEEIAADRFDWQALMKTMAARPLGAGSAFPITFGALAPLAFLARETRRQATFYAIVVILFTALALDGPVLRMYLELPGARAFRLPSRFLCVTSFGAYMLIALGTEVMTRNSERWRAYLPLLVVLGALALWKIAEPIPLAGEYWVVGVLAALAVVAMFPAPPGRPRLLTSVGVPFAVGLFMLQISRFHAFAYADWGAKVASDAEAFTVLRQVMTPQDRFYAVARNRRPGLREKTASIFGLPSISDYEPQTSRRLADLDVMMRTNRAMRSNRDYGYRFTRAPRNRRVLDLLAARYLVVDEKSEPLSEQLRSSLRVVANVGDLVIYENPQAFPRAFFVGNATVVSDPVRRLEMIASGPLDLRHTVVLAAPPPGGMLGTPGANGNAGIEEDRSESVRIAVHAEAAGFLVLTDQDYPGWTVTVNGAPATVLHANHAFRAVAVPPGDHTVVWTYRPMSVKLGLAVSLVTLAVITVAVARGRRS